MKSRENSILFFSFKCIILLILSLAIFTYTNKPISAQVENSSKKTLSIQDMMKFKSIKKSLISEKGDWVVYSTIPNRGNGEVIVYNIESKKKFTLIQGSSPIITKDGKWVAATLQPDFLIIENAPKEKPPKPGLILLNTQSGKTKSIERVKGFMFSNDSNWLVYRLFPEEVSKGENVTDKSKNSEEKKEKKIESTPLILINLNNDKEIRINNVGDSSLDPSSHFIAYSLVDNEQNGLNNGLYIRDLKKAGDEEIKILGNPKSKYTNLVWSKKKSRIAFILHKKTQLSDLDESKKKDTEVQKKKQTIDNESYDSELIVWDGLLNKMKIAVSKKRIPAGWIIPGKNNLKWSKDDSRVFFGLKPQDEYLWTNSKTVKEKVEKEDLYNFDAILKKSHLDVWHWNDPLINSQQKKQWEKFKNRVYLSVYHFEDDWFVYLTDKQMPDLSIPENGTIALGYSKIPYQKESSWDDLYRDIYLVDLKNGNREKILTRHNNTVSLSPRGGYVVYYNDRHWFLYNIRTRDIKNLTKAIKTPFYSEDHDYPSPPPDYSVAGWLEDDSAVFIYDRFDIWQFSTNSSEFFSITNKEGRKNSISFRVKKLDPEVTYFKKGQTLLLEAFSLEEKFGAVYKCKIGKTEVSRLLQGPFYIKIAEKSKQADRILFTRENYKTFPDLWISDLNFKSLSQVSNENPQINNFNWGEAELIEWKSLDGNPLQGVVLKPEKVDKKKKYPMLVYIYRKFSDRLYRFNPVEINHRPCFPYYNSNEYVVFMPDIQFEVGRPGLSSVKCVIPGIQKVVDSGLIDPKAIALHGHSWGGYQTGFIISQTDIFAAAIAGAPVANMTSAYNGIRKGSGKARQFQYEISQSRIGTGLLDAPEIYFQNSPVFYANRIQTPLLIEFGDQDDAVPWQQGIEFYLTMRRLNKNCIMLQYNDEPHHLKKFANKLDYTIKMKEFLDYYLKGTPAPKWISEGVPYRKE